MKELQVADLSNLSRGAAFLGSGGGGDTSILFQFAHDRLFDRKIQLIKSNELSNNDLVVPIAYVGSPAVSKATGPTEAMFLNNIKAIASFYPKKNIILMPAEIGGCNALAPIVPAALLNLPILDGDLLGRAFPKLKMCKPALTRDNEKIEFYMASRAGETHVGSVINVDALEAEARKIAVAYGGSACIATYLFSGNHYQDYVIEDSISNAVRIGSVRENIGANLAKGAIITEIQIENIGGFLAGFVTLTQGEKNYRVDCLNEFYLVSTGNVMLAESPDIISLVDAKTHMPIASESLVLGMCVNINVLPAPDFWKAEKAKQYVAPNQFTL